MGFVMGCREKASWDCARLYQMFRGGTKVGRGRDRDGLERHRNGITGFFSAISLMSEDSVVVHLSSVFIAWK